MSDARVSPHNRWVVTVGGRDRSTMQWRVLPEAQDEVLQLKPQVRACAWGRALCVCVCVRLCVRVRVRLVHMCAPVCVPECVQMCVDSLRAV